MAWPTGRDAGVKLLIVTPWPLDSRGGGQRLVKEVAVALATHHGLDVHVAAGTGLPGSPAVPIETAGAIHEVRVPLVLRPGASGRSRSENIAMTSYLHGLEPLAEAIRPDVIAFAPHYSSCTEQTAALAAQLRIPFVLMPAIHLDHRLHIGRAAMRLYRSADLVVCLSETERQWLLSTARVPDARLLLLECGWNGPVLARGRRGAGGDCVRLLTVGAFVRHKQVDHQVQAVARLRDRIGLHAHLTVAGALAEPAVLDRLRRLRRQLDLEPDVEFLPDCTDADLTRLYADANCFLFTSRSESFGLALLDAIGFGVLPVVYPHPIYSQLVESSGFGVVARRATPAALTDALRLAVNADTPADNGARLDWLQQRSWPQVSAPLAEALRRLPAYHVREGSR